MPYALYHCHVLVGRVLCFCILEGLAFCCHIKVLGTRYFQMPCASYYCHSLVGLVFCSHEQVLGIWYFQRPCASYHCFMSVGLVFCCYIQVLGIRYFRSHAFHIIVVNWWVLYTSIRY